MTRYLENKKEPLVSVLMSEYSTPDRILIESIKSILNQSYKNLEIILIDDSKKQNLKKVCLIRSKPMKKTLSIILAVMMIFSSFAVVTALAGKSIDISFDAPQVGKRTPPIGKMTITNGTVEDVTVMWYKVKGDDTMEALGDLAATYDQLGDHRREAELREKLRETAAELRRLGVSADELTQILKEDGKND